MKTTFELVDDEFTARHMLNWYEYYAACKDIYAHIRNKLKHGDCDDALVSELESIRSLLPSHYPGED